MIESVVCYSPGTSRALSGRQVDDWTEQRRLTEGWLAKHPRLQLIEGAKYSPQDNPVERMWAVLKHHIANTAPATMADRIRQAHDRLVCEAADQRLKAWAVYLAIEQSAASSTVVMPHSMVRAPFGGPAERKITNLLGRLEPATT